MDIFEAYSLSTLEHLKHAQDTIVLQLPFELAPGLYRRSFDQKSPFDERASCTTLKLFTRLHTDVFPPITSPEPEMCACRDLSFETTKNGTHDDIHIAAWETTLKEKPKSPHPQQMERPRQSTQGACGSESWHFKTPYQNVGDVIKRKVKFVVKEKGTNELCTIVEESLDEDQKMSWQNIDGVIWQVAYYYWVLEQEILDLPRKSIIG